jgi:hypothetical protein
VISIFYLNKYFRPFILAYNGSTWEKHNFIIVIKFKGKGPRILFN